MPMPSEEGAAAIVVDWKRESVETVNRGSLWPCFGRPHSTRIRVVRRATRITSVHLYPVRASALTV